MKKICTAMLGVAGAGALLLAGQSASKAGDHQDSPVVQKIQGADIYDLYAWMDPDDPNKLDLVMTVPPEGFSNELQYVFHVNSASEYGGDATETLIMCTFDAGQTTSCWVGDQAYVSGKAGDRSNPLQSEDGKVKVFVGPRNDPFFFNMDGFMAVVERIRAMPGSTLNDSNGDGCPELDPDVARTLLAELALDKDGEQPVTDDFAGRDVSALVMQVDKGLVNPGGDVLGVWASTNRKSSGN